MSYSVLPAREDSPMRHWKITKWCSTAVAKIHYPPDRNAVFEELRQHMDDRSNDFLEKGFDENEALEKTMEVMGDPYELAPMLGAIHRPYWGFAYSITKWLCIFIAAVALLTVLWKAFSVFSTRYDKTDHLFDYYEHTAGDGRHRVVYTEPNAEFTDSGYRVTLTKASLWETTNGINYTYFQLEVKGYHPRTSEPDFCYYISARDSLGRKYASRQHGYKVEDGRIAAGILYHTAPFTWLYDVSLYGFDPEGVEWVDICYERDGREHTLRIDLTGGDTQ